MLVNQLKNCNVVYCIQQYIHHPQAQKPESPYLSHDKRTSLFLRHIDTVQDSRWTASMPIPMEMV